MSEVDIMKAVNHPGIDPGFCCPAKRERGNASDPK